MNRNIPGLHHVTAIAGEPQHNLDFYAGVLGLRLVKLTVNFDLPETYHLYYGDGTGSPGTILTFFPWPRARGRQPGNGQITTTSLGISEDSVDFWLERLRRFDTPSQGPTRRLGEAVITLSDPDGLSLELVAAAGVGERQPWEGAPVPREHAIRGIHGITLSEAAPHSTASLLVDALGFRVVREEADRSRYAVGTGSDVVLVDLLARPGEPAGRESAGTVHHVAWRTPSDEEQAAWRQAIGDLGFEVTPVRDRQYFRSIYFREPGGVLFEIATDPPGFATDEPVEGLGTSLKLPPWLESQRQSIERRLPPLRLPAM